MSQFTEERSSEIFNLRSPVNTPRPKVRLTFVQCDFIETKKREVISRGITPLLYSYDLHQARSATPLSQINRTQNLSPFLTTLSKRNANSPVSPRTWKQINSNIKRPRYDDTPIECGFGKRNDRNIHENLFNFTELGFDPLPTTQVFKKPYLNFEKYYTEKQPKSNAKTFASFDQIPQAKQSVSKTSIIDMKETFSVEKIGCNCRNSKCLKLYCECLRKGGFCEPGCSCLDCENHTLSEVRKEKIKAIEKKNPMAFKPVVVPQEDISAIKVHNKGCNCKKSNCLKNYCECHQFGIQCSENCKCVSCKNTGEHVESRKISKINTKFEIEAREILFTSMSFD